MTQLSEIVTRVELEWTGGSRNPIVNVNTHLLQDLCPDSEKTNPTLRRTGKMPSLCFSFGYLSVSG